MRTTTLLLFTLFLACHTQAQTTICGHVTDSLTHEALVGATVTLQRGTSFIDYAISDDKGRFSFKRTDTKNLNISVTYLGYRKKTLPVVTGKYMSVELVSDAITLKEVTIRSGRISLRQDTIKYDLARFASSKDKNVKDVLKKLPGIDVDENSGKISYQGKDISHFYVEGMDVTGGSYNQVNENLDANVVESAEIIERHQPIRSLRNKVPTDAVALNLKLKPEARTKWIWNTQAGIGYGDESLYQVHLNALQLAKTQQGLYTYKTDHSGKDMMTELQQLTFNNVHQTDEIPSLIGSPSFSMPLDKHRLLDNDTHLISLNRIYRKDEIKQNRISLRYLHDEQKREQGTSETYHYPSDTIRVLDLQDHRMRTDFLRTDWDYEMNGDQAFSRNVLTFQGKRTDVLSQMSGDFDLFQRIRTHQIEAENKFNTVYNKENYTWGIRSYLHYTNLPSSLQFGEVSQDIDLHQAYTDNQFYYLRKRNGLGIELTTGANGRLTYLNQETDFKAHRLQFYARPNLSWEKNQLRMVLTPSVIWEHHPNQGESKVHFNPQLYIRHQLSPRWSIQASASLQHNPENPDAYYPSAYYMDYRTLMHTKKEMGNIQYQSYMLYTEYKRPVKEFFWTLALNHFNSHRDHLIQTNYEDGRFHLSPLEHPNRTKTYQVRSIISKGFYDWNLKASLEVIYNYGEGIQAGQGTIQPYKSHWLSMKPKVDWTPTHWLSASYQANFNQSRTCINTPLPALWDIQQRLSLNIGNDTWNIHLRGEHYYNEVSKDEHKNLWLADVGLQYNTSKWRWSASLNNIFNQEEYRYTTYSDIRSYTSWIKMRPREYLVSVQYKW